MEDKLREDFSIEWDDDHYVSRREFFKFVVLASGGLAGGSAVLAAWPRLRGVRGATFRKVRIAAVEAVPIGGSVAFDYPGPDDLCILLRRGAIEFDAYSRRCTHLSCPVQYQADKSRLYCPCHNGAFSVESGEPTQGPPTEPLQRIVIEVSDGAIYAVGLVEQ
jgi:Rieske Fe-S protein